MSGFAFEKHSQFCAVRFTDELTSMTPTDVEAATNRVIDLVREAPTNSVLVDLSHLQKLPPEVFGSLKQTWNSLNEAGRRFVVVAPDSNVATELSQDSVTAPWVMTESVDEAYDTLGVTNPTDMDISAVPKVVTDDGRPYTFTKERRHCEARFNPMLMSLDWAGVEHMTTELISAYQNSAPINMLVDLSDMEIINSSLVASLVRFWKAVQAREGHFAVVSPNETIIEILQTAGLGTLLSVVETRDEAIYELGAARPDSVEQRELNVLTFVAIPCAVVAVVAVALMLMNRETVLGVRSQLAGLLLSSAAIATGGIAVVRDSGMRRYLSAGAVVAGLLVLSTLWFNENPISFEPAPGRNLGRERNEDNAPKNNNANRDENSVQDEDTEQAPVENTEPEVKPDANAEQSNGTQPDPSGTEADSAEKPNAVESVNSNRLGNLLYEQMKQEAGK